MYFFNGITWINVTDEYTLRAATDIFLGGVIVGDGLVVDGDGRLSVSAPAINMGNILAFAARHG
jgi:hypothetical protein